MRTNEFDTNEAPWERFLSDHDRKIFAASGYGRRGELTQPSALVVVDMTSDFIGDRPEDTLSSIERFPNSCGAAGWDAAARLVPVLAAARASEQLVVFTTRSTDHMPLEHAAWGAKQTTQAVANQPQDTKLFADSIAPRGDDVVIPKTKPSAFFDTPLIEYLISRGVRQVICCGATTSGCVRATVVDAFSFGFKVAVIGDCTVDRGELAHAASLFDMNAKYADLISSDTAIEHFRSARRDVTVTNS